MSQYPPCAKRMQLVAFQKDGSQVRIHRCAEQTAPLANKDVDVRDCTACPVRVQITKAAATFKPTRLAEIRDVIGTAPDPNAGGWPKCVDRQIATTYSCCGGSKNEHKVCNSIDCYRMGAEVTQLICGECVFRKDKGD